MLPESMTGWLPLSASISRSSPGSVSAVVVVRHDVVLVDSGLDRLRFKPSSEIAKCGYGWIVRCDDSAGQTTAQLGLAKEISGAFHARLPLGRSAGASLDRQHCPQKGLPIGLR